MKPHKFLLSVLLISAPAFCSQDTLDGERKLLEGRINQFFEANEEENYELQKDIFNEIIVTEYLGSLLERELKEKPSLFLKAAKDPLLFFTFLFSLPSDKPTEAYLEKFWHEKSKFDGYEILQNIWKVTVKSCEVLEIYKAYVQGTINCILHHEEEEQGEIISLFSQVCAAQDYPMLLALLETKEHEIPLKSLSPLFDSSFSDEQLICLSEFYNTIKSGLSINSYEAISEKSFRAFYIFLTNKLPNLAMVGGKVKEQYSPYIYWQEVIKIIEFHKPSKKYTPLHFAAQNGHLYILPDLIKVEEKHMNIIGITAINIQDGEGNTPLHYAALRGDYEMAEVLLQNGASPDIKNNEGHTPLKCVAFEGTYDTQGDFKKSPFLFMMEQFSSQKSSLNSKEKESRVQVKRINPSCARLTT